jgi:putative phosphoribosyl transferase
MDAHIEQLVRIPVDEVHIEGMLELPPNAQGVVLFAHGSGSSRHSPRNNYVARVLRDKGIGTLLLDLLTISEDMDYQTRFDIPLLTHRLWVATRWVKQHQPTRHLPIGYFGASTGAAAALQLWVRGSLQSYRGADDLIWQGAMSWRGSNHPPCCWLGVLMMK